MLNNKQIKSINIDKIPINYDWLRKLKILDPVVITFNTGESFIAYISNLKDDKIVLDKWRNFTIPGWRHYFIDTRGPNAGKESNCFMDIKRPTYYIQPISLQDEIDLKNEK